jgi:hypothetical protein
VTSNNDAVTDQFEMERVRCHFTEEPEVVVHDRKHKVYLGAPVRNPALALIRGTARDSSPSAA